MFHTRLCVGSFANKRDLRLREFGVEHVKGFACATYALLQPSKVLSGWCSLSPEFLEQQNSFLECVARVASTLKTAHSFWSLIDSFYSMWTPKYTQENKADEKHHKNHCSFWPPWRLAAQVSSYLDSEGLCAERATSRAKSSVEAQRVFKRLIGIFKWNLFSFQAFVGHVVELVESQGSLAQMANGICSALSWAVEPCVATRPAVFKALSKAYCEGLGDDESLQYVRQLAQDNFPLYAGLRGCNCLFGNGAPGMDRWWKGNPRALSHLLKYMVQQSEAENSIFEFTVSLGYLVLKKLEDMVWGHAHGQSSAECHQCGHQCLWEGWTRAGSFDAVWGGAQKPRAARCHQLQCSQQRLWKSWTMAASIHIVWGHAQGQSSAECHQCGHQCLWEGWTRAGSFDAVWGGAQKPRAARCHQLQCSQQRLWKSWTMAASIHIVWGHAQGQSSAECHQCGHQCLWEGWTRAGSFDAVWGGAQKPRAARCHQLQCSQQRLWKSWTMAASIHIVWGHAQGQSSAECHQCGHQCLWEGWTRAGSFDAVWGGAQKPRPARCHQLQCSQQRLWKSWTMAASIHIVWGHAQGQSSAEYSPLEIKFPGIRQWSQRFGNVMIWYNISTGSPRCGSWISFQHSSMLFLGVRFLDFMLHSCTKLQFGTSAPHAWMVLRFCGVWTSVPGL